MWIEFEIRNSNRVRIEFDPHLVRISKSWMVATSLSLWLSPKKNCLVRTDSEMEILPFFLYHLTEYIFLWFLFSSKSLRAQSFTSLKEDSFQDINRGFVLSRGSNGTFPWRENLHLLLFSFGLRYQCLNGAIPSWKCSFKTPAKWRNSDYVLTELCHQRSKWLGPKNGNIIGLSNKS